MNNILVNVSAVIVALALSYFVFWYRNHKMKLILNELREMP